MKKKNIITNDQFFKWFIDQLSYSRNMRQKSILS